MTKIKTKNSFWAEFTPKSWTYFKGKYTLPLFKSDLLAGVTVGIVALPLAMAFAIAAGLPPEKGLITAIVAGFLISLLGGSRLQIGGPTGAFVVIIYDIVVRSGYDGLIVVTLLAGIILLIAAFSRLGALIKYIPYPLITGFTTGIAVIIFSSQIKDFFGLKIGDLPANFLQKWEALFSAFGTFDLITASLSSGTLLLIILIRRFYPKLPWGIISVVFATLISWGLNLPVDTIASRFGEMQRTIPLPTFHGFSLSLANLRALIPDALVIAFLAGIESLLSAVVADGMAGTRHKSNCELMAQGVANIGSVLFGGIPATGAIARTVANIKTGAKTPIAGMIHSITILIIILAFAPIVSKIPLASLSAVLIMVAWNMSEMGHFRHLFTAPFGDIAVLLTTFLLTVLIDLTVAVEVGMILAVFLFMKRMGDTSKMISVTSLIEEESQSEEIIQEIPPNTEIYEITGPFFFGVADSLKGILSHLESPPKVFILLMRNVPIIDASGMHALREFHYKCNREGTILLLSGVKETLIKSLKKFGVVDLIGKEKIFSHIDQALKFASKLN